MTNKLNDLLAGSALATAYNNSDMAKVVSILVTLEGILNKVAESIEDINRRLSALERKE